MPNDFFEHKLFSVKAAGYDEAWLQDTISESPNLLGIGDLRLISREKIISSGGRLDILLQDTDEENMYEVEVQLGETDPSHIIRTIEYWDLIRKKYPQRQHFAVLVAEGITKRFFNVISLLSANIPIIAIQCQIVEIDGKRSLVFTKVLDAYEEPEEIQSEADIIVDEKYWEGRASLVLALAKRIFAETKEIYKGSTLVYNKYSIVVKINGNNMIKLHRKSGNFVHVEMKHGNYRDDMVTLLEKNGIPTIVKYEQVRFTVSIDEFGGKMEMIKELAKYNINWWKLEDA
jgi:hypothetical protein